jgi:HlyD family secretion protein
MARKSVPLLPILSLAGAVFATWSVLSVAKVEPAPPAVQPPRAPFADTLAGAGVVEPAAARTTAVSAPFPGLVAEVFVTVGQTVEAGAPLFRLDDRGIRARLASAEADVAVARGEARVREGVVAAREAAVASAGAGRAVSQARLDRLLAMPRPEELPAAEAKVGEAAATKADLEAQLERLRTAGASTPGVVSADAVDRARFAAAAASETLHRARADLALAKAGAWAPDVAEARALVAQADGATAQAEAAVLEAKADVERAKASVAKAEAAAREAAVDLERSRVTAPGPGTVLDVAVRPGEYAVVARDALVVFGDLSTLHVRVDVDEESAPMVKPGGTARAVLRGFPDRPLTLDFVRIEPWIRPKVSLTGAVNERVDTRVLQVVFRLAPTTMPVYVGQQVDVFMEGVRRSAVGGADASPAADGSGMEGSK